MQLGPKASHKTHSRLDRSAAATATTRQSGELQRAAAVSLERRLLSTVGRVYRTRGLFPPSTRRRFIRRSGGRSVRA